MSTSKAPGSSRPGIRVTDYDSTPWIGSTIQHQSIFLHSVRRTTVGRRSGLTQGVHGWLYDFKITLGPAGRNILPDIAGCYSAAEDHHSVNKNGRIEAATRECQEWALFGVQSCLRDPGGVYMGGFSATHSCLKIRSIGSGGLEQILDN